MYRRSGFAAAPIHKQNSECEEREIASKKIKSF
jgi:hypothetical protein